MDDSLRRLREGIQSPLRSNPPGDLSRQQRLQASLLNARKRPQMAGYLTEPRNSRLASNCVTPIDVSGMDPDHG